jgi:hypothetical protein
MRGPGSQAGRAAGSLLAVLPAHLATSLASSAAWPPCSAQCDSTRAARARCCGTAAHSARRAGTASAEAAALEAASRRSACSCSSPSCRGRPESSAVGRQPLQLPLAACPDAQGRQPTPRPAGARGRPQAAGPWVKGGPARMPRRCTCPTNCAPRRPPGSRPRPAATQTQSGATDGRPRRRMARTQPAPAHRRGSAAS